MWLKAAIALLTILAAVFWGMGGWATSFGHTDLANQYYAGAVICACVDAFLVIMKAWHWATRPAALPPGNPETERKPHQVKEGEQFAFGVFWSQALTPFCPVCDTPLALSTELLIHRIGQPVTPELHCFKCNKLRLLYDDEGGEITLAEAKKRLTPQELKAKAEPLSLPQPDKPKPKSKFGVLWDENRDPFCPVCEKRLIPMQVTRIGHRRMGDIMCMSCQVAYVLNDDDGKHVTLVEAKKLLRPEQTETKVEPPAPQPPQLQTTISSVQSAAYEPDEADIEILKEIAIGNGYESQIAEVLKLNAVQVRISLSLLSLHDFIKLHRLENRGPCYQLTDKGRDFLDKPHYKAPHPSGSEGYKPDGEAEKILLVIADPDADSNPPFIAARLRLHPERVKRHLSDLEKHGYVDELLSLYDYPEYNLRDKGRDFLMSKGHF